jgi:hypothetical protein
VASNGWAHVVLGWHLAYFKNRIFPTGAGKSRCFVLLNGRGALPLPLAMLLVQIRVQGEGEAKLPSFLTYRLISVPATNREDKAVYTETQLSQIKSQKYRPILSHLVLRVAQAFDIYERAEMNQAEIYGAASSRSQKCLLGTGAWCIWIPSTHFSIKAQQLSRKSYMLWMSLKLQVTKPAACLCLLMSFLTYRASSSCQGPRRILSTSVGILSALSIYLSKSPRPGRHLADHCSSRSFVKMSFSL